MKNLLKMEELFLFILSVYLFLTMKIAWWWFPALILVPDIGMIGYIFNTKTGAIVYNVVHHRAVSVSLYIIGAIIGSHLMQLAGIILFAHSSIDRVFNFGLKFTDNFKHTHLTEGEIL